MKASGIYFNLNDKSQHPSGTSDFIPVVVGKSKKGSLNSLNLVTAKNVQDVLASDVNYAPELQGLFNLLEVCAKVKFLRINVGAKADNVYITSTSATTGSTNSNLTDPNSLASISGLIFGAAHKDPGKWGSFAVSIKDAFTRIPVSFSDSSEITLSANQRVYKAAGTTSLIDTNKYKLNTGHFVDNNGNIIAVLVSSTQTPGSSVSIYKTLDNGQTITGSAVGTYTFGSSPNGDSITISGNGTGYANMILEIVLDSRTEWILDYGELSSISASYDVKKSYRFSLDSASSIYWKLVDFGDVLIAGTMVLTSLNTAVIDAWLPLQSGGNGEAPTLASQINLDLLKGENVEFLAVNGIQTIAILNAIIARCDKMEITNFIDVPDYTSYSQVARWRASLIASAYAVVCWVPDIYNDGSQDITLWPSMNYLMAYALMRASTGSTNYPPAGHKTGAITAYGLLKTDAEDFADELKTAQINWQRVDNRGACIWEQRTLYRDPDSDLSYISTHCIIRDLKKKLVTFMQGFNFSFTTASELLTIDAGLKSIFDKFKSQNFLSQYEVLTPSFEEAQKMGREVDINMSCSVMQDGEVYNLNLTLQNYQ